MLPSKAPVAPDIDFAHLGESFDFTGGQISRVVYRAAARAAVRPPAPIKQAGSSGGSSGGGGGGGGGSSGTPSGEEREVTGQQICMEDFVRSAQDEESKTIGEMEKMVAQWFL